ncbi:hypothetical protein NPIL_216211 [Nephila pilipes]|uniref:Uncharacterized protein n=1 Tax=Nephila pilipes TaxID=299642 RepID=A0A8X6NFM5_NEPPI|nr:hypothetical protein NPIL_216211 [Nephila pilipes]
MGRGRRIEVSTENAFNEQHAASGDLFTIQWPGMDHKLNNFPYALLFFYIEIRLLQDYIYFDQMWLCKPCPKKPNGNMLLYMTVLQHIRQESGFIRCELFRAKEIIIKKKTSILMSTE